MSEKLSNSPVLEQEQNAEKSRFDGTPVEVPIQRVEIGIPDSEKDKTWKPGVMDSNNGLVAAHDKNRPVVYLLEAQDYATFKNEGYEPGSATVPLTGGDQRGWHKGTHARDLAKLHINASARRAGVKGRELKQTINGREYDVTTMDPFDKGDFIDMSNVAEIYNGQEKVNRDLVEQYASGEQNRNPDEMIGKMSSNNGVLAWITPEGKVQIAPYSAERASRLSELGYTNGDIFVPHSNGEIFKNDGHEQAYAEITFGDMQRKGEKMTMQERQSKFGKVVVPVAFMDLIKN